MEILRKGGLIAAWGFGLLILAVAVSSCQQGGSDKESAKKTSESGESALKVEEQDSTKRAYSPWPSFGNNARNSGLSEYQGAQTDSLKWRYETGAGEGASPAIGPDGTIYVGSEDNYLYAINPDGSLKWRYETGDEIHATPAVGLDSTVYVGSGDGYLYALSPAGSLKWRNKTGGLFSSPTIDDGETVYMGSADNHLYALNLNGEVKWRYETGDIIRMTPAVGGDGTVYVGSQDGQLYALNAEGSLKWRYTVGRSIYSSSLSIDENGTIYIGSRRGYLHAVSPAGSLKWKFGTGSSIHSSPAIGDDGTVYVGSEDKQIYAINSDGSLKWRYKTDGRIHPSPVVDRDGTVYVGLNDYNVYALRSNGTLQWRYRTEYLIQSSPAIGRDGTIYVGSLDGYLYAIGGFKKGSIADKNEFPTEAEQDRRSEIRIYRPGEVDRKPKLIGDRKTLQQKINYPEEAARAGIRTRVKVAFIVNKKGDVEDLKVPGSIPDGIEKEAIRVIKQASFKPALTDGEPVNMRHSLTLVFDYQNQEDAGTKAK